MNAINKRIADEANFQASIHGVKLKSNPVIDTRPLNKEQELKLEKIIQQRLKNGPRKNNN